MAAILKGVAYIIAALVIAVGIAYFLYNMSHTESTYEKWGWVYNPNTGKYEWMVTEAGKKTEPPNWWGWVIAVVGLGIGGLIVYKLIPLGRSEK